MNQETLETTLMGPVKEFIDGPVLTLAGISISLRSNSESLLFRLSEYFAPVVGAGEPDIRVLMIERDPVPTHDMPFVDWQREPGKTGRKDAYFDVEGARVIRKVRTGMLFLQSEDTRMAAGPCLDNDNQVINFINAQYMNYLQQNGALILHASGLVHHGKALGIAGFSGGGKSTLMLHMLDREDMDYLTNDRLFVRDEDDQIIALGIPKLPRINPGTIINNDRLRPMLTPTRVRELEAMDRQDLWDLEEKYDVDLRQTYGKPDIASLAPLSHFLILNWKRDSEDPCTIRKVDLQTRQDLLPAIMKSPGPFYQDSEGGFFQDSNTLDPNAYINAMKTVTVYEATGKVDFNYASAMMLRVLDGEDTP